jgi:formamidopyrimidine-DNA glycosylase
LPEGDSLRRLATRLQSLVGKTLTRVTTQGLHRDLTGRQVTHVDAHGKHLLIDLDDGTQIRTHLGMNGRVRDYPRLRGDQIISGTSPGRASLVLATADHVWLWLTARTVEIAARRAPMRGVAVAALGPDVLAGDFDSRLAASRAAAHSTERAIAETLLDQRIAAGIGNIWKCESLFACGIDPHTPTNALSQDQLAALYSSAHDQMTASVRGTRPAYRVYLRGGKPCTQCGTPVAVEMLGGRWTWWCPQCQAPLPSAVSGNRSRRG